nr:MarR family transcriptional regulator [Paenibacillus thalictri]
MVVLSKAYKSVMEKAAKDIKRYGMSPSEFGILEVLYTKGKIPIQKIGEKILISSGTMTYNVDKLEKRGLVARIPCQEDRRVVYAELTDDGRQLFERIFPQHAAEVNHIFSGLTAEQKLEAIEMLKIIGKGVHIDDRNISDN